MTAARVRQRADRERNRAVVEGRGRGRAPCRRVGAGEQAIVVARAAHRASSANARQSPLAERSARVAVEHERERSAGGSRRSARSARSARRSGPRRPPAGSPHPSRSVPPAEAARPGVRSGSGPRARGRAARASSASVASSCPPAHGVRWAGASSSVNGLEHAGHQIDAVHLERHAQRARAEAQRFIGDRHARLGRPGPGGRRSEGRENGDRQDGERAHGGGF